MVLDALYVWGLTCFEYIQVFVPLQPSHTKKIEPIIQGLKN